MVILKKNRNFFGFVVENKQIRQGFQNHEHNCTTTRHNTTYCDLGPLCINCSVPLWLYTAEQLTQNVHNIATTTADKQTTKLMYNQTYVQKLMYNQTYVHNIATTTADKQTTKLMNTTLPQQPMNDDKQTTKLTSLTCYVLCVSIVLCLCGCTPQNN